MDVEERDIAKQVFGLTDEQLDKFLPRQRKLLIKVARILDEELKENPEILEKVRSKLFREVTKFYAELKNI